MAFFPGFGAGAGKSFSLDVDGGIGGGLGAGLPFGGGAGGVGGLPLGGGWGGLPYVPVTPLGALGSVKGDLLVPIVTVGVALFILILIVLAVKAALAWKLSLIGDLANKKFARDTEAVSGGPPQEDQLNQLAQVVLTAIQSQTCAQNMICQVGTYARTQSGLTSLLKILESMVPTSVKDPLAILRSSAEGSFNCDEKYKCRSDPSTTNAKSQTQNANSVNKNTL